MLSLAAYIENLIWYRPDLTHAYPKSSTSLEQKMYNHTPSETWFISEKVLKVAKPLYGITKSGRFWNLTYTEHHVVKLGMSISCADLCLLYKQVKSNYRLWWFSKSMTVSGPEWRRFWTTGILSKELFRPGWGNQWATTQLCLFVFRYHIKESEQFP